MMSPKKNELYISQLFRTCVLFGCFFSFGFSRSLAGPTMLELEKQVKGDANAFQIVFLLGAITFPLGNILAGFIMERISPSLVLFFATLILSLANCSIPFSPNITALATGTAFAEFALGLIDTGANVYCLQIWADKSGPYFSALHMAQGVGFLMAPILAERVLPSALDSEMAMLDIPMNKTLEELLEVVVLATEDPSMLSPLQALYLSIGLVALIVAVSFVFGIPADLRNDKVYTSTSQRKKAGVSMVESWGTSLLITLMTFYSLCAYGLSFAYGSFLTAYAVFGSLKLSPQRGARLTSFYYGAQVAMRALNIVLVGRFKRLHLMIFYIVLVALGTFVLYLVPSLRGLTVGSIIVGLGSGSLFPMGLLWLQGEMEVSAKATGLFCLASSLGAQFFRLPEGAFIATMPEVHLYLLSTALSLAILAFVAIMLLIAKRKTKIAEAKRILRTISGYLPKQIQEVSELRFANY